jgi:hypothetical protein
MQPNDIFRNKEAELRPIEVKPSIYDIDYTDKIKGTLLVWAIPLKCNILDEGKIPPILSIAWAHISSYLNRGEKGKPDNSPIPPELLDSLTGPDLIRNKNVTVQEPYSEFFTTVKGTSYTVRAKTVVMHIHVLDRLNLFGDPVLSIGPSTTVSVERRSASEV